MEIAKNKWVNLLILFAVIVVAVLVAVSMVRIKPDEKNPGLMRLSLGGIKKNNTAVKPTT